jgi:HEAT repeat protein
MRTIFVSFLFFYSILAFATGEEPSYNRRTLDSWMEDMGNKPATPAYGPAAEAIKAMGADAVPDLLNRIEAGRQKADHAVNAFRVLGPVASSAIPRLGELVRQPNTAPFAARALVYVGAEDPVVDRLSDTNPSIRKAAIVALASKSSGKKAVDQLLSLLSDRSSEIRYHAAWALGQIRKEPDLVIPALIKLSEGKDAWVSRTAVQALGFFAETTSRVPIFINNLSSDDPGLRAEAAIQLGSIMSQCPSEDRKRIVDELIRTLDDKSELVQSAASSALGTPCPETRAAFPGLLELAKSPNRSVVQQASAALKNIDREAALKAGIK